MRITPRWMAVLVVSILFGGILLSIALGEWTTKSTKEPLKFSEGDYAGEYNPADIRGSYTFGDISELFDIPLCFLFLLFRFVFPEPPAQKASSPSRDAFLTIQSAGLWWSSSLPLYRFLSCHRYYTLHLGSVLRAPVWLRFCPGR